MKHTVLIVDDHNDFRKIVREYLEKSYPELEIFEAFTAEMAVTKAACIKPELVVMDVNLPGENGFGASRQIKEDNPNCKVIVLTMFETESFRKLAKESLADDFIGKSEVYKNLIPAVNRCFNGQKKDKK